MRGLLRWLRRLALTGLALALIVVAVALITAHTAWGREHLRLRIEATLHDAFPGGARVGSLDGSILGTLTLHGVELDAGPRAGPRAATGLVDRRDLGPGRVRVTAGTLRVAIALWPLVFQTARLDHLVAEDVHVIVRDAAPAPPAEADRADASPWRVEMPDVAVRRAAVEIERAGLAIDELDAAGALTFAAGRLAISGAAHGRSVREHGPAVEVTAHGTLAIDGSVQIPAALVLLDGAAVGATGLVLDVDRPRGSIALVASARAVARLVPELGCGAAPGPLGDVVAAIARQVPAIGCAAPPEALGDVAAAIEIADDGADATRLAVTAASGEARLWVAARGQAARRTARVLVSATAIDLALVTRGRVHGHGNLIAGFRAVPGGAQGALIAHGDVDLPDLPVRRAAVAVAGSLDDATVLVLGSGDDALQVAVRAATKLRSGAIVVDDALAIASSHGARWSCQPDAASAAAAGAAGPPCSRLTGELTARAHLTGTLAPGTDLHLAGVAAGTHVRVERRAETGGRAEAESDRSEGRSHGRGAERSDGQLRIAALRSPFRLHVSARSDGTAGLDLFIEGDAAATALVSSDVSIATAAGSYALGLAPAIRFDRAHLSAAGIRRAGRLLGDAVVDVEQHRGGRADQATYGVAATVRPALDGVIIAARAAVRQTGSTYRADLATTRVVRGGSEWTGHGGTVMVHEPTASTRTRIEIRDVALRREGATIGLRGAYAAATGALDAHLDGDRIDASAIDARLRGTGRGTLDLARHRGQWGADATLAVAGLAVRPDAASVDTTAHLALAGQRLTLEAHAGPALGGVDLAFDAAAPRDPFDVAAWRRLDRDAIHTASITAHQVALSALFGLGAAPTGTIDGTVDLAPAQLRGGFALRDVATPVGTVESDIRFAPGDGDLAAIATVRLAGVAEADLTGRFAVPQHPLDPATWRIHGRDLMRGLAANLEDTAFDARLLEQLGRATPLAGAAVRWLADQGSALPDRGHVRAALALGAAAGQARLSIDLTELAGGALVAPVSVQLVVSTDRSGTHVHGELHGRELGLGALDGELAMTTDRWLDDPAAALRAPLTARWTLPATPVVPVMALFGRHDFRAGTLDGAAMICGTIAAPIIPAVPSADDRSRPDAPCGEAAIAPTRLVARDLAFARRAGVPVPTVQELAAVAAWDGANGSATIDGLETTGGALHASLVGRPGAIAEVTGGASMKRFDIASIARFLPGWLASAAGTVDGTLELRRGGQIAGELIVTDGALSFPGAIAKIGTLRHARARLSSHGGTLTANVDGQLARGKIHLEAEAPLDLATVDIRKLHLDKVSPIVAPRPIITADLTATLHREPDRWTGNVKVEQGAIALSPAGTPLLDATLPPDLAVATATALHADAVERTPGTPPAHTRLVLDVSPARVHIDAQVRIARELVDGVVLTGTLHNPEPLEVSIGDTVGVRGKVEIESNDLKVLGRPYQFEETKDGPSGLMFDGTLDPLLDVRMSHRFTDLLLLVDLRSHLSRLERPTFASDAGTYTEDQLFNFFLGGDPGDAGPTRDPARDAVAGVAARWISGQFGNQLSKVLPIPVEMSCEPDPAATTVTIGSCTVGTRILDRLYVTYRRREQPRADENGHEADAQVRLGRGVLLELTGGDRLHLGMDLLWPYRW